MQVTPSIRVTETLTDNVDLSAAGQAKSDWITLVSPSLFVVSRGARVEGTLRASVNAALYGEDNSRNNNFVNLNGTGRVTAIENLAFVDLLGSISKETISVFGSRPADEVTGSKNLTEVKSFGISPYLLGRFASTGKAELRYNYVATDSAFSGFQNSRQKIWTANLTDATAFGNLGWGLNFRDSLTEQTNQRDLKLQTLRFTGFGQLTPQLQTRLIVGSEENNYAASGLKRSTIVGAGADIQFAPRSKFSGTWEDRFYGPGYLFSVEHSTGLFNLSGRYSKDVSYTSQSLTGVSSLYGILAQLNCPDLATRDSCMRPLLAANPGIDKFGVSQTVLNNGVYLDRRATFSASYLGAPRTMYVFSGFRSERNSLVDQSFTYTGDFQTSTRVTDVSGSLLVSHKLTPITSANADYTLIRSHNEPNGVNAYFSSRTQRITVGVATAFTPKANGTLSYRYGKAAGTSPYTENAVIGSLMVNF